jgi:hypothetical protein
MTLKMVKSQRVLLDGPYKVIHHHLKIHFTNWKNISEKEKKTFSL